MVVVMGQFCEDLDGRGNEERQVQGPYLVQPEIVKNSDRPKSGRGEEHGQEGDEERIPTAIPEIPFPR